MILKHLSLKHFRNYIEQVFLFTQSISIISGENGMGKTNMLEAISLLEKPKGLRGGDLEDIQNHQTTGYWMVRYDFDERDITITYENSKKKILSLGKSIPHTKVHEFLKVLWLGPQNDRVFSGSPENRRKFFDTILSIFEPEYKILQNKYLHYVFERTKLLYQNEDIKWLTIVEQKIYDYGKQWQEKRRNALEALNVYLKKIQYLNLVSITALEGEFSQELIAASRSRDIKMGGCGVGPHKTDYRGFYGEKALHIASNGEQCLGQISIFIALILYMVQTRNVIFLMDEIFSYLDAQNQKLLISELQTLPKDRCQILITLPKLYQDYEEVQYIQLNQL
jgi:DNA replication and repair protein RecF